MGVRRHVLKRPALIGGCAVVVISRDTIGGVAWVRRSGGCCRLGGCIGRTRRHRAGEWARRGGGADDRCGCASGCFFVLAVLGDVGEAGEGGVDGLGVEGPRALVGDGGDLVQKGLDVRLRGPACERYDGGFEVVGEVREARIVVEPGLDDFVVAWGEGRETGSRRPDSGVGGGRVGIGGVGRVWERGVHASWLSFRRWFGQPLPRPPLTGEGTGLSFGGGRGGVWEHGGPLPQGPWVTFVRALKTCARG